MNYDTIAIAAEKLRAQKQASFLTSGVSMKPLFKSHRDIAVVKPIESELKVNDVVLYSYPKSEKMILHRIIKTLPDGTYIIRGDNTYKNEYVKRDMIIGVLSGIYRKGKYIDCRKSKPYLAYIIYIRLSYPIRFVLFKVRRMLGRIKRSLGL